MVDYQLRITIYNEIRENESITLISTLCILSTEAIDPLWKYRFNQSKNSNFLGSLERELLCP